MFCFVATVAWNSHRLIVRMLHSKELNVLAKLSVGPNKTGLGGICDSFAQLEAAGPPCRADMKSVLCKRSIWKHKGNQFCSEFIYLSQLT